MIAFIAALPPHVRLVLSSRSDPAFPLGRLRVQGRLLEVRQSDLRFSTQETQEALAALDVRLPADELAQVEHLTEGWPTGVQLVGLSMQRHRPGRGLLVEAAATDRSVSDFLLNEVIDLLPPEIAEFLMVTAELDTLDAVLCDAVGGWTNSVEMLERVRAANLFLAEVDAAPGHYRYHHLFAEFLRARLRLTQPARVRAVHRAAAAAYTERDELLPAIRHLMAAGDTEASLTLLRAYGTAVGTSDDWRIVAAARRWLAEHGAASLEHAPAGILDCTIVLNSVAGAAAEVETWLRRVEQRRATLDAEGRFLLHAAWSFYLLHRGDPSGCRERAGLADQIRRGEDFPQSPWLYLFPHMLVMSAIWLDDLEAARRHVEDMRDGPPGPPLASGVRAPGFAAHVELRLGELGPAEALARQALEAADRLGAGPGHYGRAEPELVMAAIHFEHDRLDEADAALDRVMLISDGGHRPPTEVLAHLERARVAARRGDVDEADDSLRHARSVIPNAADGLVVHIDRVQMRLLLDRGDVAGAEALGWEMPPSVATDLLMARLRLARGDHDGAGELLEAMGASSRRGVEVERGLLLALALAKEDLDAAHAALHEALVAARPADYVMTFVREGPELWQLLKSMPAGGEIGRYVERLLEQADRLLPSARSSSQVRLIEPLSEREITVLRHLASRLNTAEIAAALYLSVNTVRSHVKAIYRKLAVNSRAEAVSRARQLGLF